MTETTRLELELADALGLVQAVRTAAADARERVGGKLEHRLDRAEHDLAELQEALNELVVAAPGKRAALTRRSREARDTERTAQRERVADADAIDALQALASEAAYSLAQWAVVRRLAKTEGHEKASKLAKWALPAAREHLELALEGVDKLAKRAVTPD